MHSCTFKRCRHGHIHFYELPTVQYAPCFFPSTCHEARPGPLYDRSGVVPEEFRVEEGGGSHCSGGDLNGRKASPSSKRSKRMDEFKELMQASLGFAAESGLFGAPDPASARKESPVKAVLEELRDVQVQIGEWRKMEADSYGVSDVDPDSSDDDGDGISTFELAIKELKERKKELKLELNNYQKERAERALAK